MFRHLLVQATGSELERSVVETASRAADPSSSHISFFHVRMDVQETMVRLASGGLVAAGSMMETRRGSDRKGAPRSRRISNLLFCIGADRHRYEGAWHFSQLDDGDWRRAGTGGRFRENQ